MNWFDAACHAFAAMSTGGFSTHDASVAAFRGMEGVNAFQIEMVLVVFMFLAGANFALHFRACSDFRDSVCPFHIRHDLLYAGSGNRQFQRSCNVVQYRPRLR